MLTFAQRSKIFQQAASITPMGVKRLGVWQGQALGPLSHMRRSVGNQAAIRSLRGNDKGQGEQQAAGTKPSAEIQTKLMSNSVGDRYEREADSVAEQVVGMPESRVQRLVESSEERQRAVPVLDQFSGVKPKLAEEVKSLGGGGQPLSASARAFFEPRFGFDFSAVRVHTGEQAAAAAGALNADAFTVGRNVAFGAGMYAPETRVGRRLLGHELTHVIQQSSGRVYRPRAGVQEKCGIRVAGESARTSVLPLSRVVTDGTEGVVMKRAKSKRCDFADREPHDFIVMAVNYVLRKYYKITRTMNGAYQRLAQRAYKIEILINGKSYWFEVDWWDPAIKLDVAVQGLTAPYTHWVSGAYSCTNGSVRFP